MFDRRLVIPIQELIEQGYLPGHSSYSQTNPVSVGDPTRKSDYDRVFDNIEAIRTVGLEYHLGGDDVAHFSDQGSGNAVYIAHYAIVQIDGTNLTASHLEVYFEATLRGDDGNNQVSVELYNVTDAGVVANSQVNLTSASFDRQRSVALSLPASAKEYAARCFTAASATEVIVASAKIIIL